MNAGNPFSESTSAFPLLQIQFIASQENKQQQQQSFTEVVGSWDNGKP